MPLVQKLNSQRNMQTLDLNFLGKLLGGKGGEGRGTQTGLYKNSHNWLMPMLHHLGTVPSTL
jgi:hypothetical protein